MFFRKSQPAPASADDKLHGLVQQTLPDADADTVNIVTSCAGLLACVGFADRDYSAVERERVRALLTRVQGIGDQGAAAIDALLHAHIRDFATVQPPRFTRALREAADRDLRLDILGMLVEVAAADDVITHDEVTLLRQLTTALGLEQSDYNELQAQYRDKLAALKK